jgi:hypothetical protein
MDADKSVMAGFRPMFNPVAPVGALNSGNNTFSWTGVEGATWYFLEVYDSSGARILERWIIGSAHWPARIVASRMPR